MRIYLPFEIPNKYRTTFNKLSERFGLEYTDIIQFTCEHWDDLLVPDREVLRELYEALLLKYLQREMSYRTLTLYARLLSDAIDVIHEELYQPLSMVAEEIYRNHPVDLRLVGWSRFEPVFDMRMRPHLR